MQVRKAINPGAIRLYEPWLVICCNADGNRIVESHFTESAADHAAIIGNEHDRKYGHHNQYVVRHRSDVEILEEP